MTTTATIPGCPVDESFDPLSPEFLADPYAVLARLPRQDPVFFASSIGYYVVTRHADIAAVFRDPETYSAAAAQAPLAPIVPEAQQILLAGGHKPQPSMVSLDEPEHARLRKPAARAFSMKRVTAMIPAIEATTARLLDGVGAEPEFDLVAAAATCATWSTPRPASQAMTWPATWPVTTRPVTLGGVDLPAGARLFLWLAAAGRDEEAFVDPAAFDMRRTEADHHLAFGKGLHYCLGANLGKLEAQIAIAELARRYPALRLVPDQQLTFHPNISFRGPQVLLVRTHP
jgi:cytochrome P450